MLIIFILNPHPWTYSIKNKSDKGVQMERALSQDERIRRAEEIYARRQNVRERTSRATVNISSSSEHKSFKLFKRLTLQSFICLLIYFIFYLINTTNYSFSKVTLDKTEDLISQEVDFISIYNNIANSIISYISSFNLGIKNDDNASAAEQNIINENTIEESNNKKEESNVQQISENIVVNNISEVVESSGVNEEQSQDIASIENDENVVQEEIADVELSETDRIKQKYSFIVPVKRLDII